MRIGINVSWMTPGAAGGMEWYVRSLIKQLARIDQRNIYVLVVGSNNHRTFQVPNRRWRKVIYDGMDNVPYNFRVSLATEPPRTRLYKAARWIYRRLRSIGVTRWRGRLRDLIRRERIELWFCPLIYALPLGVDIPIVVTIPDLQHEQYPQFFDTQEIALRRMGYQYSCRLATAVIGISQSVANDIVKLYQVEQRRTFATPLALDERYYVTAQTLEKLANMVRLKFRLEDGFLFFPANGWPHKNHERLIEALGVLKQRGCSLKLVLTGYGPELMGRLHPLLTHYDLRDAVRFLGYVGREELIGLYSIASMLVFPSLFEGFGLPLLEAMHLGVPVACSNIGSLPEVGGDAVLYFDPQNTQSIAEAIEQLYTNEALRTRLIEAGRARVRQFSYSETARRTLSIFEQIDRSDLSAPGLLPFRPVLPHNWLDDGEGRWYVRAPGLQQVKIAVTQPLDISELQNQQMILRLNNKHLLTAKVDFQTRQEFVLAVDDQVTEFHCIEVTATQGFIAHGQRLSIQINNLSVVFSNSQETVLVA